MVCCRTCSGSQGQRHLKNNEHRHGERKEPPKFASRSKVGVTKGPLPEERGVDTAKEDTSDDDEAMAAKEIKRKTRRGRSGDAQRRAP